MLIGRKGSTANPYLYSGEQFDSTLNLYYLRARYYNPAVGRFQTADPYEGRFQDPLTLHKYVYGRNNPVNAVDPTGQGAILEYVASIGRVARGAIEGTKIGESSLCYLRFVSDVIFLFGVGSNTGVPINQNIVWAHAGGWRAEVGEIEGPAGRVADPSTLLISISTIGISGAPSFGFFKGGSRAA